jgi:hypothetical protein
LTSNGFGADGHCGIVITSIPISISTKDFKMITLSQVRITPEAIRHAFNKNGIIMETDLIAREALFANECISKASPLFSASKYMAAHGLRDNRLFQISKAQSKRIGQALTDYQEIKVKGLLKQYAA